MNRRRFLEKQVKSLPILGLSALLLQSCKQKLIDTKSKDKKVLVIGGGISGLIAARTIKNYGFEVEVIEANNRLGGRIKSIDRGSHFIEQGAAFIHGSAGNPIASLATQQKISTFRTIEESNIAYNSSGQAIAADTFIAAEENFYTLLDKIKGLKQTNLSLKEVIDRDFKDNYNNSALFRFFVSAYLEFDTGGRADELSSVFVDDDAEFNGGDLVVRDGLDQIVTHLAKDLKITLNKAVNAIKYDTESVLVNFNSGQPATYDYVLVTVPLGVLKNQLINFDPILPKEKIEAINGLGFGLVNNIVAEFDTRFWPKDEHYFFNAASTGFNYFLNMAQSHGIIALNTWTYGQFAETMSGQPASRIWQEMEASLGQMFNKRIPSPTNLFISDWKNEPYIFGSYSFVAKNGDSKYYDILAQSLKGRVFFAGEHTNKVYRGSMHGAYLSGLREARNVLDAYHARYSR